MAEEGIYSGVVKDILKLVDDLMNTAHNLENMATELMRNMTKDIGSEDIENSKSKSNDRKVDKKITTLSDHHLVKCELCEDRFYKISDLETHLKTKHKQHQTYECDNCKKKFLTNWRLDKHARIHNGSRIKR